MSKAITTSIRLEPDLRDRLEHTSHKLHRGKNWIIVRALREYLAKIETQELAKEARRQSILASKADIDVDIWENNQDTSGWQ